MLVLGMMFLVLLQTLQLFFQVADLAEISGLTGLLDISLIFLDVLVDRFHAVTGWLGPELNTAHLTGELAKGGACVRRCSSHHPLLPGR